MRVYGVLFLLIIWAVTACVSTKGGPINTPPRLGPRVELWLVKQKQHPAANEKLGVIVRSAKPLNYPFLKQLNQHYYTGHVTKKQLLTLSKDPRIVKITAGKKKIMKAVPKAGNNIKHKE